MCYCWSLGSTLPVSLNTAKRCKWWPTVQPNSFRMRPSINPCPLKNINTLYLASRTIFEPMTKFIPKSTCRSIFSHLSWKRSWASREKDGDGILPSAVRAASAAFPKETHSQIKREVNTVKLWPAKQMTSCYLHLIKTSIPSHFFHSRFSIILMYLNKHLMHCKNKLGPEIKGIVHHTSKISTSQNSYEFQDLFEEFFFH